MPERHVRDGGPAFPAECHYDDYARIISGPQTGSRTGWETGMSLRDWFAGMALTGILSRQADIMDDDVPAQWAYDLADAMLDARGAKAEPECPVREERGEQP